MNNPFEGLPRQEAERQAKLDSIESNIKMDLEESDYKEIYEAFWYGEGFYYVKQIFKKNRLGADEWNSDPKLDAIRKEVLREYVSQASNIYDIEAFLKFTKYSPDWEEYKNDIKWMYHQLIEWDAVKELEQAQEYFNVSFNWDDGDIKKVLFEKYNEYFENENYDNFKALIAISGQEPDWQGTWKDRVTDKVVEILDDEYDSGTRMNAIINLTKGKIDWQGRLRTKVNDKFIEYFSRAMRVEVGWLEELSGIKPDWQGDLKQEINDLIGLYLRTDHISHLGDCLKVLDFKPDFEKELRESVVEAYKSLITKEEPYEICKDMENLHEVVGFLPDFQKELPSACEEYLIKIFKSTLWHSEVDKIGEFIKYTGYRPRGNEVIDNLIKKQIEKYITLSNYEILLALHDVWDISEYFMDPVSREFLAIGFMKCLGSGNIEAMIKNIAILERISGISPDWQGDLKADLQDKMQSAFTKYKWDELKRLQDVSGVSFVSDEKTRAQVLDALNSRFEINDFECLRHMQDATGVRLDYAGEKYDEIQKLYRRNLGLDESNYKNSYIYSGLHEISGIELSPLTEEEKAAALMKMESYLERADIDSLTQLVAVTKLDFDWEKNAEKVDKAYIKLLRKRHFQKILDLKKMCGIPPDWKGRLYDGVMDSYADFIHKSEFEAIAQIQEHTSVIPDWEGSLKSKVLDSYATYVSIGYFVGIQKLQKISGITPDWQGELLKPRVTDYYMKCAEGDVYESIKILQEMSKVQPDWEGDLKPKVMESYAKYVSKRQFDKIQDLQVMSGIVPDWTGELRSLVIEIYIQYSAGNRMQKYFDELEQMSGISYSKAIKDPVFWDLATEKAELSLVKKLIIDDDEVDPEVRELFERRLKRIYAILLNKCAGDKKYFEFVEFCIKDCGIKPLPDQFVGLAQKALGYSDVFNKLNILFRLCNYRGIFEFKKDDIKDKYFNTRQIALMYALDMLPKEEEDRREFESELKEFNHRAELVKALINARGVPSPASRDEYCPWKNELEPLLNIIGSGFIFESAVNIPALVDYVQRFGMKNLPVLARVSMDLYNFREKLMDKSKSEEDIHVVVVRFSEMDSGIKLQQFLKLYGSEINLTDIKSARDIDKIYELLDRVSGELKEAVLRDEMPRVLEQSPITMELFNSVMVRSGRWANNDHGYTRETLMAKWRQFKESGQEELPEFYKAKTYGLRIKKQESLDELSDSEGMTDEKIKVFKLKEAKQEEKGVIYARDEYITYLAPFYVTLAEMDRLGVGLGGESVVLAGAVATLEAKLKSQKDLIEAIGDDPKQQKKKQGIEKGMEKQEELLQKVSMLRERGNVLDILRQAKEDLLVEINALAIDQKEAVINLPNLEERLRQLTEQMQSEGEAKELKNKKKELQKEIQKLKSKINQSPDEWKKDLERLSGLLQEEDITLTNESKEYLQHQRLLSAITYSFDQKIIFGQLGDAVRLLTMRMAELESQGHVEAIREAYNQNDKEKEFKAWKNFFQEELLEHFIDPDYADEPRKVAMPSQVNGLLESVWRLNNIRQKSIEAMSGDSEKSIKHPFIKAVRDVVKIDGEINALENEGVDALVEKVEVTYSPCQGLGRIFAGDVGDACYTSYRHEFADGKFPNLHSLIMSKKENDKDGIKLLGSVLLIDGIDVKGKKYLFARAVNPMDSVLKREIKAEEFLDGLLDYLKTTADEAGLDEAVLCVDTQATASGSNRQEMFDAMVKAASVNNWPIADELEKTPETNFKYSVWNTRGRRVYRIWQREQS